MPIKEVIKIAAYATGGAAKYLIVLTPSRSGARHFRRLLRHSQPFFRKCLFCIAVFVIVPTTKAGAYGRAGAFCVARKRLVKSSDNENSSRHKKRPSKEGLFLVYTKT